MNDFSDWERANRRRATCLQEGLCTCCSTIWRAGDPLPRLSRAAYEWTCGNGNRELLCSVCFGFWQENVAEDDSLRPHSVRALNAT